MFTRMAKGLLWILGIVVVVAGAVFIVNEDVFLALIIWGVGFLVIWGFGIFVELTNNIMDIKNGQIGYQNNKKSSSYGMTLSKKNETYNLSQLAQEAESQNKNKWVCSKCGERNASNARYCKNCGKYI